MMNDSSPVMLKAFMTEELRRMGKCGELSSAPEYSGVCHLTGLVLSSSQSSSGTMINDRVILIHVSEIGTIEILLSCSMGKRSNSRLRAHLGTYYITSSFFVAYSTR